MIQDIQIREWYYRNKDHRENEIAKILGVEYAHIKLEDKDDLYVTKHDPFNILPCYSDYIYTNLDFVIYNRIQSLPDGRLRKGFPKLKRQVPR